MVEVHGLRDIVGTRICHADADTEADTNGIRTGTHMSTLTFGVGTYIYISNGFDITERTRVCGRNGYFQCSWNNNTKKYAIQSYGSCNLPVVLW